VICASISSSGNVYAVKFDPRTGQSTGLQGPVFSGAVLFGNHSLSCVTLAMDVDQITYGGEEQIGSGGLNAVAFDVTFASGS
jgi:hypothetical protein